MTRSFAALALLSGAASAVDLTFMDTKGCSGQPLFGKQALTNISCHDVDGNHAESVHMQNFGPNEVIQFFSDAECKNEIYSSADSTCYTQSEGAVAAFRISVDGSHEKRAEDVTTTDLVEYGVKLSDYTGLTAVPTSVDLRYSNFFIGASALALSNAVTISALAVGCYSAITGGGGIGIYGCVAGPIATILSYVAYHFLARAGQHIENNINMASGTINDALHNKRDLIDSGNHEYLHTAMNVTGSPAVFAGHTKRDLGTGEQTSPVYEIDNGDGNVYHFSVYTDEETGAFIHHVQPRGQVESHEKRAPGYKNIRWNSGGLDFTFCNYNAGDSRSVFQGKSLATLYNTAYADLSCLLSSSTLQNSKAFLIDLYNGNSDVVGEVNVVGYRANGPSYIRNVQRCQGKNFGGTDSSCIN